MAQQSGRQTFHVASQPVEDALLDLALQSRRSLGGDLRRCRGRSPALSGPMTLDEALTRLLAGSGCSHVVRADGAIVIRRAQPRSAAAPRPAPSRPVPPEPSTAPAEPFELSEIVVTAPRHLDTPQSVPAAIAALPGYELTRAGATDLGDVAALTAGMTVTNLGSGRNKILLRGMSDGAFTGLTQSTVALYLDRIPITYSAPDPDLKLIDVDRVELVRGPQGTLYGTGPLGGVVHIVPNAPDFTRRTLSLGATQSRTRGGSLNSDYWGTANLPLFDGALALRGSLYEETYGGYVDDVSLNLPRVNDGGKQGGRLALAANLAPGWVATAGWVRQRIVTEDTHYIFRTLGGLRRANLVREPHRNAFDDVYVSVEGQGGWGRFQASAGLIRHQFNSRYDASSGLWRFGSLSRLGALDEARGIDLAVAEATFASPGAGRVRWLAGVFASRGTTRTQTAALALRPIPVPVYEEARLDALKETALFGEVAYDLREDLTLTAGARYYVYEYATTSDVSQYGFHRPFHGEGRNEGVSPKLAAAWRARENLDVYAQITQGHRTGGFNTAGPLGQPFSGGPGRPGREYGADSLWNYELGAKATLLDGRLRARASLFAARWDDIQSDQFLPSGLAYAVNVGDGENLGLEIETRWRVNDELELSANGLLARPRITRPGANFNSRGDAGLPGVPSVSANLYASWRRPWVRDVVLAADVSLAYVGDSRLTFDADRRSRMGDYVNGRVSVGFEADLWSLRAFVDNPLDSRANTFSFGDPFRLPEALASTPLQPRTVGLTLQWFPY